MLEPAQAGGGEQVVKFQGNLPAGWYHLGTLKLAIIGMFAPWKPGNTTKQWFSLPKELVVKRLPQHHCCYLYRVLLHLYLSISINFHIHRQVDNHVEMSKLVQW